jgi:hypothetical protein
MRAHWSCAVVLALLTCGSARPDTITVKDNLGINGSLLEMSKGVLRMKARFPSEEKVVWISIEDVQSIEFNLLTSNPGAPPKILGFGPPSGQDAPQKISPAGDVIVLRGGTRHACILVGIDTDRVHCDPNGIGYNRSEVLRIALGSR